MFKCTVTLSQASVPVEALVSPSHGRVIACAQTQTLNENICSEIHSQTQVELLTASELPRALEIT